MIESDKQEPNGGVLLAAEYVLGVLGAEDRRAAERRIAEDTVFAREVAYWEERLGGIADAVPDVAPPPAAWSRIEAALARETSAAPKPGIWNNRPLWRGLALAAGTLAAACIAALIYVGTVAPPAPLLARLDAEGGQAGFVAAVSPGGTTLTIVPASLLSAEQKSMELWLIPDGEKPHSLGLIDPDRPVTVNVPESLLHKVSSQAVLAVSLEPPGGSPTGQPTGPVIAHGKLAAL